MACGVSVFVSTCVMSGALSLIEFLGRAQAVNVSILCNKRNFACEYTASFGTDEVM